MNVERDFDGAIFVINGEERVLTNDKVQDLIDHLQNRPIVGNENNVRTF